MKVKIILLVNILILVGCERSEPIEPLPARVEVVERMSVEDMMDCVVHLQVIGKEIENYTYYQECMIPEWQGSGFFVREDGIIITAAHVVRDATDITVTLRDGTEYEAEYFWPADNMDVGFVKIEIDCNDTPEIEQVPFLEFDRDGVELAEDVYILGHPFGDMNGWSITKGIISNLDRDTEGFFGVHAVLQADASSWPGNSGGCVLDMEGRIVGVLVGGIRGQECLSYIVPGRIAKAWCVVFESWLLTR